jgi:hypothetical protein
MPVDWAPADDGDHAPPRQSYNFAPGYHGLVYRAEVPDWGAGPRTHKKGQDDGKDDTEDVGPSAEEEEILTQTGETKYKLDSMKWGMHIIRIIIL